MKEKEKKRLVKDEAYFQISGWMVNPEKMNLKGLELQLYAIIFGLSQDGNYCHPSIQYLAEFTGATDRGVRKALDKMADNGVILKRKSAEYKTNEYLAVVPDFEEPRSGESKKEELSSKKEELSSEVTGTQFRGDRNSVPQQEELSSDSIIDNNIASNIVNNEQDNKDGSSVCSFSDCPNLKLTMSELLFLNKYYGRESVNRYCKKLDMYIAKTGRTFKSHLDVIEKWITEDSQKVGVGVT